MEVTPLHERQRERDVVFTSGVSKMRLTCMRLVMCQVYLENEPRGSPSFLTNADVHTERQRTKRESVFVFAH